MPKQNFDYLKTPVVGFNTQQIQGPGLNLKNINTSIPLNQDAIDKANKKAQTKATWLGEFGGGQGAGAMGAIAGGLGNITKMIPSLDKEKNSTDAMMGKIRDGASDALLMSGNPYAMAAGAAIKVIDKTGGFSDASKGLGAGKDIGNAAASLLIPGAGYFLKPTDSFKLNDTLGNSSGYTGMVSDAGRVEGNAGAKLLFGRNQANHETAMMHKKQNKATNILEQNTALRDSLASNSQDLSLSNQMKKNGGWQQGATAFGKDGIKVERMNQFFNKDPFETFKKSLPKNLQDESNYRLRRMWELGGKPNLFDGKGNNGLFTKEKDRWYAKSVDYDPNVDFYQYRRRNKVEKHQQGGTINVSQAIRNGRVNVIPGGAMHAHKHKIKDSKKEVAKQVTQKGVPVVTYEMGGAVEQHAEIERGEIVFRKSITDKLEKLWKDGNEESMIKAGKILVKEILYNTIDKSEEYEIENKQ